MSGRSFVVLLVKGEGDLTGPIRCGWKFMTSRQDLGLVSGLSPEMTAVTRGLGLSPISTAGMDRWAIKR
jgi:hypothetical protein